MHVPLVVYPGCKKIIKAYPTQKLGPYMIGYSVDYFAAILSRVDVYAERPFAKWHFDDFYYSISDSSNISVWWLDSGKALLNLIRYSIIQSRLIFCSSRIIVWRAGVLEVISSRGESTWYDNGCLYSPTS